MRVLRSLFVAAVLVAASVPATHADEADAIAAAYGDLSVFVLDVAAGHDGVPPYADREQVFRDAFAEQFDAI